MANFGLFRGFSEKLFEGELPNQLGIIGSQTVSDFNFLLDFFPNAGAAFSLRKLRTVYTGNAIKVRRTNNDELDIGFDSFGNLDTAALLAFTGTGLLNNGFITTWYDQSGNARNATQTTALNQPQIVSSGSVISTNSKPIIEFTNAPFLNYNGTFLASTKYSIFAATLRNTSQGTNYLIGGNVGANNSNLHLGHFNNTTYRFAQFGNDLNTTVSAFTSPQLFLVNALNSTTGKQLFFNNSLSATNANTIDLLAYLNASIGRYSENNGVSNVFFNGRCSELIIYPSDKTSDLTAINTNINNFYSIY